MKLVFSESLPLISISILFFYYLLIKYYNFTKSNKSYSFIPFIIRLCVCLFILILISKPIINWTKNQSRYKNISIYVDNSSSMKQNLLSDSINFDRFINDLKNKLTSSSFAYNIFLFGDSSILRFMNLICFLSPEYIL